MKFDTAEVGVKAACFLTIGFFTPVSTALAQYANTGEWPSRIMWVAIGVGAITGGATQLLSFMSGSYTAYIAGKATNGNSNGTTAPVATPSVSTHP